MSSHILSSISPLNLQDVLSPDDIFWTQDIPSTSFPLPFTMKKDITEAYFLMQRSKEEQQLVEMRNALDFWNSCAQSLQEGIDSMRSKTDLYSRGAASTLQQHLWTIDFIRCRAEAAFQLVTDDYSSATAEATFLDIDFSDTESDTDSDT